MGGRASKQKGNRNERGLVRLLIDAGFAASRSPLSGAMRGQNYGGGCDVEVKMFGRKHRVECKHHANGFARLYKWLVGVDFLIVRADRSEPLVVMPLSMLITIAKAAEQIGEDKAQLPERSNGPDCKSGVSSHGGSNPPLRTKTRNADGRNENRTAR